MGSAARACDDDAQAALVSGHGVFLQIMRRTMRGNHPALAAKAKFRTGLGSGLHGRPIRVTAHDDADNRLHRGVFLHDYWLILYRTCQTRRQWTPVRVNS